jgi:hypothetical protein
MARITVAYIPYNTDVGFLQIKQDYIDIDHWRIAFFVHVYASMWALLAVSHSSLHRSKVFIRKVHRASRVRLRHKRSAHNRPAALLMSVYANGGPTSKIAFALLAIGWITFTALALRKAAPRRFRRSPKLHDPKLRPTLSAPTLRAWKWSITNTVELPPMDVYRALHGSAGCRTFSSRSC